MAPEAVDAVFYDVLTDEVVRPASLPGRAGLEALVSRLTGSP